ncbi:DUF3352 domain-containing protein [Nocardioides aquiterrae]|uniref:DUF3352 domain-containing protein n=1 Tax=Nocardioides aquiterrae TaxID=203799 RepID=A0ABN1UG79_9ACTN
MSSTPEYLDSHGGSPQPPGPRGGRRTALIAGGAVGLLAVVGVGAWAAWSFFSTGPQPAAALPASTVGYVSIDLDPSGGQKIEALRTLRKFPEFRDQVGLDTDDDVRKWVFEEVQGSTPCGDLDYEEDVEPWLGDRMAVAAVDNGADQPEPVIVLQVSDEGAADRGLAALRDCSGEQLAWNIADGWALLGETQDVADGVAADAADASLADDGDFQHWTDEAGGDGIVTAYLSPEAGRLIADQLDSLSSVGGLPQQYAGDCAAPCLGYSAVGPAAAIPDAADALKDFGGLAATVRFSDGSLELEVAADAGGAEQALGGSDAGDDVLATLPDDTAAALGVGFAEGWLGHLVDADTLQQLADATGLDLPGDAEALAGRSAALAVSGDIDLDSMLDPTGESGLPVGLKVQGDTDRIAAVVDRIGEPLGVDTEGDTVVVGPDADYREQLLANGGLGGTDAFRAAVPDAGDAGAVLFVNFDAGSWFDDVDELEPLAALGASVRVDDSTSHLVLRVTTD